jgi:hypothetical protein
MAGEQLAPDEDMKVLFDCLWRLKVKLITVLACSLISMDKKETQVKGLVCDAIADCTAITVA